MNGLTLNGDEFSLIMPVWTGIEWLPVSLSEAKSFKIGGFGRSGASADAALMADVDP